MDGRDDIPLVPGPTMVPAETLDAMCQCYGSADLESDFFSLYQSVCDKISAIVHSNDGRSDGVVIQSGEGMLALWGGLKSCLTSGDAVLCISNGVFGTGISEMAKGIVGDSNVHLLSCEFNMVYDDLSSIREAVRRLSPRMITAVHCETPSGTITRWMREIGEISSNAGSLFYVDFVASAGATAVSVVDWNVDIGLWASQKVLSMPPALSITTVSPAAWKRIEEVGYAGYDALLPWRRAVQKAYFPYTHNWNAIAALDVSCDRILSSPSLEATIERHQEVSAYARDRLKSTGVRLYPVDESTCSPTVTSAYVPKGYTWEEFDEECRKRGVTLGGGWGKLKGVVFRVGHMGTQATMEHVKKGMDVIEEVVRLKEVDDGVAGEE